MDPKGSGFESKAGNCWAYASCMKDVISDAMCTYHPQCCAPGATKVTFSDVSKSAQDYMPVGEQTANAGHPMDLDATL